MTWFPSCNSVSLITIVLKFHKSRFLMCLISCWLFVCFICHDPRHLVGYYVDCHVRLFQKTFLHYLFDNFLSSISSGTDIRWFFVSFKLILLMFPSFLSCFPLLGHLTFTLWSISSIISPIGFQEPSPYNFLNYIPHFSFQEPFSETWFLFYSESNALARLQCHLVPVWRY